MRLVAIRSEFAADSLLYILLSFELLSFMSLSVRSSQQGNSFFKCYIL